MRFGPLLALSLVGILTPQVFGQGENDVKKGTYPHMAFIYYLDDTITDATGARFLQSAFLIRLDWLVTSSIEVNNHNYNVVGFPTKTLLARVGAVTIDTNFTVNEEEDEQEQEIIQVVRPFNHNASVWWRTDISLLKTLFPFNYTMAVNSAFFNLKKKPLNKSCFILNYIKESGNFSDDKVLKRTAVEVQIPSTKETCGPRFVEETMICAIDNEDNKDNNVDFCVGNSGGPLMCDKEVVAIQTYIEGSCKPPYLYQLLSEWENFISCGTDDKCQDEACANQCISFRKDPDTRRTRTSSKAIDEGDKITKKLFQNITSALPETVTEEGEIEMTPTLTAIDLKTKITEAEEDSSSQRIVTTTTTQKTSTVKEDELKESLIGKRRINRKMLNQAEEEVKTDDAGVEPRAAKAGAERHTGTLLLLFRFLFWYLISI